jgi:drug/metabolite transporter (DMT)-like permease
VRAYDPALLQLNPWGAVLGVLSAITQAAYTLLNRRLAQSANTHWVTTLTYTFVFGCITLLGLMLIGARAESFSVPSSAFPWIAALALGPTIGGYGFFNWALSKLSGRIVSLIVITEAPIAALIGVTFLNENLEALQWFGIALILIAIVLPSVLASTDGPR